MKWSEQFATGIERIDTQHKMLFQMAADFRYAIAEGRGENVYAELLRSLTLYAQAHFGFEEGCMARHHCPAAERNLEAHGKFIEILAGFQARYRTSGFDAEEGRRLVDTIERWLAVHIGGIDIQLKQAITPAS